MVQEKLRAHEFKEIRVAGLRERQRESRRGSILEAAHNQFVTRGFKTTTIETIAAEAAVSAVTVYNYYGTKKGLLLALIAESDTILFEKIEPLVAAPPQDLLEAISKFASVIRENAVEYLTKPVWRQAIAAAIIDGGSEFGKSYSKLDIMLAKKLSDMLRNACAGCPLAEIDFESLGNALFELQNAHFLRFISNDDLNEERVDNLFRADVRAIMGLKNLTEVQKKLG